MDSSRVDLDIFPEGLSLNPFGWAEIEAAAPPVSLGMFQH